MACGLQPLSDCLFCCLSLCLFFSLWVHSILSSAVVFRGTSAVLPWCGRYYIFHRCRPFCGPRRCGPTWRLKIGAGSSKMGPAPQIGNRAHISSVLTSAVPPRWHHIILEFQSPVIWGEFSCCGYCCGSSAELPQFFRGAVGITFLCRWQNNKMNPYINEIEGGLHRLPYINKYIKVQC